MGGGVWPGVAPPLACRQCFRPARSGFVACDDGAEDGAGDVRLLVFVFFGGFGGADGLGGSVRFSLEAEDERGAAAEFGSDHEFAECGEAGGGVFGGDELLAELGEGGEVGGGEAWDFEIFGVVMRPTWPSTTERLVWMVVPVGGKGFGVGFRRG